MKKYPTFPFNPKDFLSDHKVVKMTDAEVGFYVKMLCHDWLEGGIPLTGPVAEWYSKGGTVAECFVQKNGRLFNPRLEKEREKRRLWSEKSSIGGRVGAEIKKLNVKLKGGTTEGIPPLKGKRHREPRLLYKGSYQKTSELFAQVAAAWNNLALKKNLSPVLDIIPGSLRAKNLLSLFSLEGFDFQAFIDKISTQAFLMGGGRVAWRASFDWAIKLDNYMKIMEAQYEKVDQAEGDGQGAAPARSWDDFTASKTEDDKGNPFEF